jgi:alginate O-acetyltransferase complex protein AlgI
MLFNSPEFIFAFLPVTFVVYFLLNHLGMFRPAKVFLFLASLVFYGWWSPKYLVLIGISILVNFFVAEKTSLAFAPQAKKSWFAFGIIVNVALLGYYKYADFFIGNVNTLFAADFNLLHIILPLGISFFTFQQIAYQVDAYKGVVREFDFVHYGLFVTFFPQLIAGPIVHHKEIMPQFMDRMKSFVNWTNVAKGIFVFNMGLAKKIVIADTLAKVVNKGYANFDVLSSVQSWITAFAYTMQLYFDFSGYSDMAIGLGLLFNIVIPVNFWSPHKAEGIQQFYRRWHITLSSFLREYVYIPLGGNRKGEFRTNLNLFLTFLIGGFWHGANWTFVIWGALNGIALVVQRLFQKTKIVMPHVVAVSITFLFVMLVRVFFRADSFSVAMEVLQTMFGAGVSEGQFVLIDQLYDAPFWAAAVILLFFPNTNEIGERFSTTYKYATMLVLLLFLNLTFLNSAVKNEFLYFDF